MRRGSIYKIAYRRWGPRPEPPEPGYTLFLLIPGDLPVFLRIALMVCGAQDPEHRAETIVLPDMSGAGFDAAYETYRDDWDGGPLRVVKLHRLEEAMTRRRANPHLNCWLQFKTGVQAARTRYAIWHDADLFLGERGFLRRHFEALRDRELALLGLSDAWDPQFARDHGRDHMVSTWELALDLDWVREFAPWEHRGHDGELDGRPITFDITFAPQARTAPERIMRQERQPPFVHFNHTIGTYRKFQQGLRAGRSFNDSGFSVLLVRLLVDALDESGFEYDAPSAVDLLNGIADPAAPVTYGGESARLKYPRFRNRLAELLASGILPAAAIAHIESAVKPWDEAFSSLREPVAAP